MVFLGIAGAVPVYGEAGPPLTFGRIGPAAATVDDGRFLVAGGHGPGFTALRHVDIGAPESGDFTRIVLPQPFDYGAIARLQDGTYLLAGSAADLGIAPGYDSACIFDPSSDTATATGYMTYARMNCVAATLTDGRVLVVGGWYDADSPLYGDLYDPESGTFSATGPLANARANPVVLPTADGRAVVFGGTGARGGAVHEVVEIYDPETNAFSVLRSELIEGDAGWLATNPMKDVREMRLDDGRYAFRAYKLEEPTRYGFALFDPVTLACTVDEIPTAILDGTGFGASAYAVDGNELYFLMARLVSGGPTATVRVGGYEVPVGPEEARVTAAVEALNTPYYPACAIRGDHFFSAGSTMNTGGQANFGATVATLLLGLPQLGEPDYRGWYYVDHPWMFRAEGAYWMYLYQPFWAHDYMTGADYRFGGD